MRNALSPLSKLGAAGVALLLLAIGACGGGRDADWAGSTTDSAGVTVVHNPSEGLWVPDEAWTLEEELSIGSADARPEYQFGQISGMDVGDDGTIYVADNQAHQVRVFDPDGTYVRTIGSPGSGPGQLGIALAGVFLTEGEVRVADLQNLRVSRFTPEGDFVGSFRLDVSHGLPIRWGKGANGELLGQVRAMSFSDTATGGPTGDVVVAFDSTGSVHDTLTTLPVGQSLQIQGGQMSMRLFEPEPLWDAGSDGRLVTGRNSEYRIEVRGPDGALRRVVTLPFERRPVTERDQQVFLDAIREAASQQAGVPPEALDAVLSQIQFGDFYPAFASLLAGPGGTLWVQSIRTGDDLAGEEGAFDPQDIGSNEWDVFDADGRYLGVVTFPGRFQPVRVVGDRFYGVGRDEMDVQSVTVYRLVR